MRRVELIMACIVCVAAELADACAQPVPPSDARSPQVHEGGAAPTPPEAKHVSIVARGGEASSALVVRSSLLPELTLEFLSCEALLDGGKDFGMFPVRLTPQDWKTEGETLSYVFDDPQGLKLRFAATPEHDSVRLEYTLTNASKTTLARAHVHPCLPTVGASTFYPGSQAEAQPGREGRAARAGRKDFSELYARLFLWSKGEKFSFRSTELGKSELHTAFMFENQPPIEWNWWKNGSQTFDVPLIALESKDGKHVLALGFERALWASSNVGDARACMHLFPSFGELAPGKSATVKGRLYLLDGKAEDALKRFRADFAR